MIKVKPTVLKYIIASLVILILVWALGPYLAIDGKIPFRSLLSRLAPTILIVLAWAAYVSTLLIRQLLHQPTTLPAHAPINDHLMQQTRKILNTIKNTKKPWVLLLGQKNAGKTALLANAETPFTVKNSQSVTWWLGNDAVVIDPVGNLCFADPENIRDQEQWQQFLNYLKNKGKRSKQLFDATILTVALSTLTDEAAVDTLVAQAVEHIAYISQYNQVINITLVITQCDRIRGFQEFFADLGPEERHQRLGFTLTNDYSTTLRNVYQERFNAFISRISERLIWRLHHEHNLSRRTRIKDFPLQLEKLGSAIGKFIDKLPLDAKIHIGGVYFTSSLQTGNVINLLAAPISKNFQLPETKTVHHLMRQKPYFIQPLFSNAIFDEHHRIHATTHSRQRLVIYHAAVIVVVAGIFFGHHAYRQNVLALNSITAILMQSNGRSDSWLVRINSLQHALTTIDKHSLNYYRWFGLGQAATLRDQISASYQQRIRSNFVLYLDQLLIKKIQTDIHDNPSGLYSSLQTYLMLVIPDHRNPHTIKRWFANSWANTYQNDKSMQQQLMQHLNYLLALKNISWPTDQPLINQAQTLLEKQPLAKTVFTALANHYSGKSILLLSEPIDTVDGVPRAIPAMYSAENFKKIYNQQIPHITNSIQQNNWIIGNTATHPIAQYPAEITQQVQAIYLKNYIQAWQTTLTGIKLTPPKNVTQLRNEIQSLKNPNSPLWQLLNAVIKNAVAPNKVPDTNDSNNLGSLIAFLHKNNTYQATQVALQDFNNYIKKIATAPSPTKSAYDAAAARLQKNGNNDPLTTLLQVSKQLPTPINQWLASLANHAWTIILANSHQYLATLWAANVAPEYNSHINNRFPIFKNSANDITIKGFNHFFGPGGTMQSFFNDQLKPFVNTDHVYWTWKSLDGQHLNIPQQTLDMIIRASMIQKMFYSDNPQAPTIQFNLTPIDLSPNISRFELNIGGQMLVFTPGIKKATHLSWPGSDGSFVTLRFATVADSPTITLTGPWAWLHLVKQSIINSTNNPKEYQITFTLKGNTARYQLRTDNPINPYQAQILWSFRAPDSLY